MWTDVNLKQFRKSYKFHVGVYSIQTGVYWKAICKEVKWLGVFLSKMVRRIFKGDWLGGILIVQKTEDKYLIWFYRKVENIEHVWEKETLEGRA
jgi:hypothetical protein